MKVKLLLASVIFLTSIIFPFMGKNKASAEAEYSLELSIDTLELPRNWIIEPHYKVEVPVRVSNNPGITYLAFLLKQTNNVPESISASYNKSLIPFNGVCSSYWPELGNGSWFSTVGNGYYDANDIICYIVVRIPEDAQIGDFYSLEFAPEFNKDGIGFVFEKDGKSYTEENFGKLTGGGVRIVDDRPLYAVEPDYINGANTNDAVSNETSLQGQEQPVTSEEKAASNNQNNDKSSEKSEDSNSESNSESDTNTTTSITKDASESKITSTSKATSKSVSTSDSKKKTTISSKIQPETVETSVVSQYETTNETASGTEKKKNHIPEFVAAGILIAGVINFLILQKLTKKE